MARQCKVLNVAEKNDAARGLSNVMGRGRVRRVSWYTVAEARRVITFDYNAQLHPKHCITIFIAHYHNLTLFTFCRERDFPSLTRFTSLTLICLDRFVYEQTFVHFNTVTLPSSTAIMPPSPHTHTHTHTHTQNCHMIMTSVSGHLLALDFNLAYRNW